MSSPITPSCSAIHPRQASLFRHVSAEKAVLYRCIMACFASAKRQFRLHLRPDEVQADADWRPLKHEHPPSLEDIQAALTQLTEWGNLESQPDTGRVTSLSDFYRAHFLYRLSQGGESVETALETFSQTMARRAELQTIALEDISLRLKALKTLADTPVPDVVKVHESLRDLVRVFEGLADNAQAFMAGIARSIELQQAEASAVILYKRRLIDYLERFIGDLVARSGSIASLILQLEPHIGTLLWLVAERQARDSAPGDDIEQSDAATRAMQDWEERWRGLLRWFLTGGHGPAQSELLRARARAAIPQLLTAIATLNERRSGRSDRSADFRVLANWFAACQDDGQAHRLARAAFALNPARHFSLDTASTRDGLELPASTPWAEAPTLQIHPRLREYGQAAPRGPLPRIQARDEARKLLAARLKEEHEQIEQARQRLCTASPTRLSELGTLESNAFSLFLGLLGEALARQPTPDQAVSVTSGDGLLDIRLEPLGPDTRALIHTPEGVFAGRDHLITITRTGHVDQIA
ncbi:MAG: TIGR02677 family protein [Lautropia sp.]|nr:TIGR02677 family protein [Lautropia sp.]